MARPEYAIRYRTTRCSACHINPVGGSFRNANGKAYGAYNFERPSFLEKAENYASLDLRVLYYLPEKSDQARSGLAWMSTLAGVHLPAYEGEFVKTDLVFSYDFASSKANETYAKISLFDDRETHPYPQYFLFGRVHAPFGLLTDEHRQYTKIQTDNAWNGNLETGLMASGNPIEALHYDLAAVNGQKTNGALGVGNAKKWGVIGNLRWTSPWEHLPLMMGGSYSRHNRTGGVAAGKAYALYSILVLDQWMQNKFRGSLQGEVVWANEWSDANINTSLSQFLSDPTYKAAIVNADSVGWYGQIDWEIFSRLVLLYRYEQLALDRDNFGDRFARHGFGAKGRVGPNMMIQGRYERATVGQSLEAAGAGKAALNTLFLVFQASI